MYWFTFHKVSLPQPASKILLQVTDTKHQQPAARNFNAVILHIFSHVVRIMLPLCVRCVSPVSWAQIRWGGFA